MAIITISKGVGTDSEKIASKAAEKLGYEYIGKNLLAKIAKELNISKSDAKMYTQASSSRLMRYVDKYTCSIVQKVVDHEYGCFDDDKYYSVTKKLVEDVYEEGNAIILGWGAQCILKDKPNTLHVRFIQSEEKKIAAVMEKQKMDAASAKEYIKKEEAELMQYIKHYFKEDWNNVHLYNLVIDTGNNSIAQAVDMICDNVKYKEDA